MKKSIISGDITIGHFKRSVRNNNASIVSVLKKITHKTCGGLLITKHPTETLLNKLGRSR